MAGRAVAQPLVQRGGRTGLAGKPEGKTRKRGPRQVGHDVEEVAAVVICDGNGGEGLRVDRCERRGDRAAQGVGQLDVVGGRRAHGREKVGQRVERVARAECLGGRAAHERVAVGKSGPEQPLMGRLPRREGLHRLHEVHAHDTRVVGRRGCDRLPVELAEEAERPEGPGAAMVPGDPGSHVRGDAGIGAAADDELVEGEPAERFTGGVEQGGEVVGREPREVGQGRRRARPRPHHAPDPPALAVAARMVEIHLVVTDDAVVKVGHIEGAVGTEGEIDRAEPPVVTGQEGLRFLDPRRRAAPCDRIAMDDVGDDVADEHRALPGGRHPLGVADRDGADARRAMTVGRGLRCDAEAVVVIAVARCPGGREVAAAAEEHRQRAGMAVRIEAVAERVDVHAEWIHLAPRHLLDGRAVGAEAVSVARP